MPAYNSQIKLFISLQAAGAITCPQAFLNAFPIVKTPDSVDEDTQEETPAVLYTEADGLSTLEAITLYGGFHQWAYSGVGVPVAPKDAVLDDEGEEVAPAIPATHIEFTIVNPTGTLLMTLAGVFQAYAQADGQPLDPDVAIQSREDWKKFVTQP